MWNCECGASIPRECRCQKQEAVTPAASASAASIEQELTALKAVGAAMVPLDKDARRRVLRWAGEYFSVFQDGGY